MALAALAQEFSPRYELARADLVIIDVRGLDRLLGSPSTIAAELAREAAARGVRAHIALAATHRLPRSSRSRARASPSSNPASRRPRSRRCRSASSSRSAIARTMNAETAETAENTIQEAILRSLRSLRSNTGACGRSGSWRHCRRPILPRGSDEARRRGRRSRAAKTRVRSSPRCPTSASSRRSSSSGRSRRLEPLSFVLTRLLEPLSTRLERRDRGAAVLHVRLRLGPPAERGELHARRLELPTPMRDVRTLRTLALLDLESHPPAAPIDRVTVVIDPTPGRVLQHTLFTRAHPTPEQLSTLLARLGALMGQDRIGAAAAVDSYRPGAFAMRPYAVEHDDDQRRDRRDRRERFVQNSAGSANSALTVRLRSAAAGNPFRRA